MDGLRVDLDAACGEVCRSVIAGFWSWLANFVFGLLKVGAFGFFALGAGGHAWLWLVWWRDRVRCETSVALTGDIASESRLLDAFACLKGLLLFLCLFGCLGGIREV